MSTLYGVPQPEPEPEPDLPPAAEVVPEVPDTRLEDLTAVVEELAGKLRMPDPQRVVRKVVRDENGLISHIVEEPA